MAKSDNQAAKAAPENEDAAALAQRLKDENDGKGGDDSANVSGAKAEASSSRAGAGTGPDGESLGAGEDAEKVTVETTGDFMLQDPFTLEEISSKGTSTVTRTSFIDEKLKSGQLREA